MYRQGKVQKRKRKKLSGLSIYTVYMCSKLKAAARKLVLSRKGQGQKIIKGKGTATQLCDQYI
jgi:hypothetical protein